MKGHTGFTIIECIVALVITTMVTLLISLTTANLTRFNHRSLDPAIDWYVFLKEMESADHHFVLKEVGSYHLIVKNINNGVDYELRGKDAFYLSAVDQGGYLPVFEGIRGDRYHFKRLDKTRVQVVVQRKGGEELTGIINFYPR